MYHMDRCAADAARTVTLNYSYKDQNRKALRLRKLITEITQEKTTGPHTWLCIELMYHMDRCSDEAARTQNYFYKDHNQLYVCLFACLFLVRIAHLP